MKFIFPVIWIPSFGFGAMIVFGNPINKSAKWILLILWIAWTAFIVWDAKRLKVVSVEENFLYVSNYLTEIVIPLSDIYDVTENFWLNTHPVTIHLKAPCEFGDKIVFMPKSRIWMFSSHPVVAELKKLAAAAVAHTDNRNRLVW